MKSAIKTPVKRQRLVIEFLVKEEVAHNHVISYLKEITRFLGMSPIGDPQYSLAKNVGYGYWQHWVSSGCHIYVYNSWKGKKLTDPLVTIDTYTCKPFSVEDAVNFTKKYFDVFGEVEWREA